ncbi:hypothetical protein BV25DRAFT_1875775 [Artomyces pyxidatus]|uniref:Uncharacterized protein n=1 Tax=Artomyces pyxidatus TaxID=48021 RepID=A0ACB8TIW3_9AGAM|nr:hypothetical protein BV25DRAFT_1875775 [Artomyces pyxidatus]
MSATGSLDVLSSNKALPSIAKGKLPPPPPDVTDPSLNAPPPPPKFDVDREPADMSTPPVLPPIDTSASLDSLSPGHNAIPTTPTHPPSSPLPEGRAKKSNPLVDLIETEKTYVDQLTGIIRKVASAWSRSNLPPPDLDLMFRSLETVYKANRSLLTRLKDIGTNPSSPKALGDLLMRWIDELEAPYTAYCERYCTGFDSWEPVRDNARLPSVLATFSASVPPPLPANSHPDELPIWTLDELFLLPRGRIKYYKKLYGRLLKGTQPGRSDYKLLAGASEKLERLLVTIDTRASIRAGESSPVVQVPPETEDEVVVDFRSGVDDSKLQTSFAAETPTGSETSSARGSSLSSAARFSNETGSTSIDRGSTGGLSIPISDLERRLSTDRCLDIFTMQPKQVRLQMLPPNLPFVRIMRLAVDVAIRFVPRSTGVEVVHPQGRIFILSDLFLVAEKLTPAQRISNSSEADMWLLYPPLAGKHLKLSTVDGQDTSLQVTVMRKEKLTLELDSVQMRDKVLAEFTECIEFASATHMSSKHPMPPMPNLMGPKPTPPTPERFGLPSSHTAPDLHQASDRMGNSRSPPPHRMSSPVGSRSNSQSDPPSRNGAGTPASSHSLGDGMSRLVLSPEAQVQQGAQRVPSLHDPLPGPMYPMRSSSQANRFSGEERSPPGQSGPAIFRGPSLTNGSSSPASAYGPPRGQNPGIHNPSPQQGGAYPFQPGQPSLVPGQAFPPQRVASAGPLGRPGGPPGPPHGGPQGPHPGGNFGMEPPVLPFGARAPTSLPQSPVNGNFAPPHPPYASVPARAPSDPSFQGGLRKSPSSHSIASQYDYNRGGPPYGGAPPLPGQGGYLPRNNSSSSMHPPQPRTLLPSAQMSSRSLSMPASESFDDPSPPSSPTRDIPPIPAGPVTSSISAQMKCKVFLKQQHAQWKSLGSAKLKLYREQPTNVKQLVVEAEDKHHSVLISTIVLTDGVERVGKTGIAIELSDKGARTGIVYMIQLRNEQSTLGLYESLLAGSDRAGTR